MSRRSSRWYAVVVNSQRILSFSEHFFFLSSVELPLGWLDGLRFLAAGFHWPKSGQARAYVGLRCLSGLMCINISTQICEAVVRPSQIKEVKRNWGSIQLVAIIILLDIKCTAFLQLCVPLSPAV